MTKFLEYTPQHEAVLKQVANGKNLDEVLEQPQDFQEVVKDKLFNLFLDCTVSAQVNQIADELQTMILDWSPGDRKVAIVEEDPSWVDQFKELGFKMDEDEDDNDSN